MLALTFRNFCFVFWWVWTDRALNIAVYKYASLIRSQKS